MPNTQDQKMRELVYRLVDMAPAVPPFPVADMGLLNGQPTPTGTTRKRKALVASIAAAFVIVIAAPVLVFLGDASTPPASQPTTSSVTSPTTSVPSTDPVTTQVEAFLQARVAGVGAEAFVEAGEVPLMYATTSGARYERFELVELTVPEWDSSRVFRVRLYAGGDSTVVEQHLDVSDERPGIFVRDDWFVIGEGRLLPGTTENGAPVARPYEYLDRVVTFAADWRWSPSWWGADAGRTLVTLILDHEVEERLVLMAAPATPIVPDCSTSLSDPEFNVGPAPEDAAALAESLRTLGSLGSHWGLEVSAPVAVRIGGVDALQMDVVLSDEPGICNDGGSPASEGQVLWGRAGDEFEEGAANPDHLRLPAGHRMRLYLLDLQFVPGGILTIAVVAEEDRFDVVVEAAASVIESIQFPYG